MQWEAEACERIMAWVARRARGRAGKNGGSFFAVSRRPSCVTPPPRGWWWMGAQSLVGAEEMRHLRSYLGPLDRLVGTGIHLVTLDCYNNISNSRSHGRNYLFCATFTPSKQLYFYYFATIPRRYGRCRRPAASCPQNESNYLSIWL